MRRRRRWRAPSAGKVQIWVAVLAIVIIAIFLTLTIIDIHRQACDQLQFEQFQIRPAANSLKKTIFLLKGGVYD